MMAVGGRQAPTPRARTATEASQGRRPLRSTVVNNRSVIWRFWLVAACCSVPLAGILRALARLHSSSSTSSSISFPFSTSSGPRAATIAQLQQALRKDDNDILILPNATTMYIPHAVFYNIYIPETTAEQMNALRIVREQLHQIKSSHAATVAAEKGTALVVFYVTLGAPDVLTNQVMAESEYCGRQQSTVENQIVCQHVQHVLDGSEVATLHYFHAFSVLHQNYSTIVTYLHNKGSFHYNEINENWRPALTEAALSEHCVLSASCNLCGLQFYTQWTPFIPGNMFTASCAYVAQLIPPRQFEVRMEEAISRVLLLRLQGQLQTNLLPDRKDFFGLARYSDEHWIASHPYVQPCDCDPTGYMWMYHYERRSLSQLKYHQAPHISGFPSYSKKRKTKKVQLNVELRHVEYYLLPGNLVKWYALYNQAPPAQSWAWKWFEDGDFWKEQVQQHGSRAVEIVTRPYRSEQVRNEPAFASNQTTISFDDTAASTGDMPPTIFWDLFVPANFSNEENVHPSPEQVVLTEEQELLKEQIHVVAFNLERYRGDQKPLVYYGTAGHAWLQSLDTCERTAGLTCHKLGHASHHARGQTLQSLYQYCQANPSRHVSYLHNHFPVSPEEDRVKRRRLVKHVTAGVTSTDCQRAIYQRHSSGYHSETCNLCGLVFYTMPRFHQAGDMWTAPCSYVNQLLPPRDFVSRLQSYISKVQIYKVWTRLNFGVMPTNTHRLEWLGVGEYHAMAHWIGSHPSLQPCDVSKKGLTWWMSKDRTQKATKSALELNLGGPHRVGAPEHYSPNLERKIRSSESTRIREALFLAGNILKWTWLYNNSVPHPKSWVWQGWFPDGHAWSAGVAQYGASNVVERITSRYELTEAQVLNR